MFWILLFEFSTSCASLDGTWLRHNSRSFVSSLVSPLLFRRHLIWESGQTLKRPILVRFSSNAGLGYLGSSKRVLVVTFLITILIRIDLSAIFDKSMKIIHTWWLREHFCFRPVVVLRCLDLRQTENILQIFFYLSSFFWSWLRHRHNSLPIFVKAHYS